VRIVAAASVHARDANGAALRLVPGERLVVEVPEPAGIDPGGVRVVAFDPADGLWVATEHAVLPSAGTLKFDVDALGEIGVVVPLPATACRLFRADIASVTVPLEVSVWRHTGFSPGGQAQYDELHAAFTVPDYATRALLGLEPGGYYRVEAHPTGGERNGSVIPAPLVDHFRAPLVPVLGAPSGPDYPGCTPYLGGGLKRFFLDPFTEGGPAGQSAEPAKGTYDGWLVANGIAFAKGVASAEFYNRAELGLGREVLCFTDTKRLACSIRKYGTPGGPVAEALDDMVHDVNPGEIVAIDTDAPGAAVRFYNYAADGKLKSSASFGGDPQPMPGACAACHQGHFLPIDPDTHVYPASAPRAYQAESVRRLNLFLYPHLRPAARALVDRLYPQGVGQPGAAAVALVPASYAAAGKASTYTVAVRDHCKLCHLQFGWEWTASLPDPDAFWAFNCYPYPGPIAPNGMFMPRAWVPRRNVLQSAEPAQLLAGLASPPDAPCILPESIGFGHEPSP
jgi:hypothetical protein